MSSLREDADEPNDSDGTDGESDEDESAIDQTPDGWPSFQRSPGNTGDAGSTTAPTTAPTERWRASLPGAVAEQVAIVDGTVYASTDAGTVHALDAATGDERWAESLDGGRSQCPCVVDGLVVVGTETGTLIALNAADGDREWATDLAGPVSGPNAADGTVYVGTSDERVAYAIDAASGDEEWAVRVDGDVVGYPAVTDDGVYVGAETLSTLEGWLHALDPADGSPMWDHEGDRMQPPTAIEDTVLAPSLQVGIYSTSGRLRGGFSVGGHTLSSPAATTDAIYAGSTGGRFAAMERDGPGSIWNVEVGRRPISPAAVTDEAVYLTADGPTLLALDVETGDEYWSRSLEGEYATGPAIADGAIFVGTDSGSLIAFE